MKCAIIRCKRAASRGKSNCKQCGKSQLRCSLRRYRKASRTGTCVYCGSPVGPSSKIHCEQHHLVRKAQRRSHYEKFRAAKKCWTCGLPAPNNKSICDSCSAKKLSEQRKRVFGLTESQYEQLLRSRRKTCAVCLRPPPPGKPVLVLDHDHRTKVLRGFLCSKCNLALGLLNDSPAILRRLAAYLENKRFAKLIRGVTRSPRTGFSRSS
jgi:hypothetical protein